MKVDPKAELRAAVRYLRRNPQILRLLAVNAAGLKLTVPLDVLRYLVAKTAGQKNAPTEVVLEADVPALRAAATVSAMGARIRAGASLEIEKVVVSATELRFELRLHKVKLGVIGESESPVAALIKSGALDLSKPGNLARFMPKRPPSILEAEGERLVIDLLREPKIAGNKRLRRALEIVTPLVGIRSIGTEGDALVIGLEPHREGVTEIVGRLRRMLARVTG